MLSSCSSSSSSSSSSAKVEQQFFTFFDFDDTSVVLPHETDLDQRKRIKNAQLLLPILLFQTFAADQHIGILTNRTADESEILHTKDKDYAVADFIADIAKMGIMIPEPHIIFGGGEKRLKMNQEMDRYVDSLDDLADALQNLSLDSKFIERFGGKNYFIRSFLDKHLDTSDSEQTVYQFGSGNCIPENLVVGIVDDLETIVKDSEAAGYFGIQALGHGKLPGNDASKKEIQNFYSDEYLIELAEKIGLNTYVKSLVETPEKHASEPAMIKMSALLYGWHAFPGNVQLKNVSACVEDLSEEECKQLICMMQYIDEYANKHKFAHYQSMKTLLDLDSFFMAAALDMYQQNSVILREAQKQPLFSVSMPDLSAGSKSKKFSWFTRKKSKSTLEKPREILTEAPEVTNAREQNQTIKQRVFALTKSDNAIVKVRALAIHKRIQKMQICIWQQSNNSSSSSSSRTLTPLMGIRRTSSRIDAIDTDKQLMLSSTNLDGDGAKKQTASSSSSKASRKK